MADYEIWEIEFVPSGFKFVPRGFKNPTTYNPERVRLIDSTPIRDEAVRIMEEEYREVGLPMGLYLYRLNGEYVYLESRGEWPLDQIEYTKRLAEAAQAYRQALYAESRLPAKDRDTLCYRYPSLSEKIGRIDRLYVEATSNQEVKA